MKNEKLSSDRFAFRVRVKVHRLIRRVHYKAVKKNRLQMLEQSILCTKNDMDFYSVTCNNRTSHRIQMVPNVRAWVHAILTFVNPLETIRGSEMQNESGCFIVFNQQVGTLYLYNAKNDFS